MTGWFLSLPEDVIVSILRDWLFPNKFDEETNGAVFFDEGNPTPKDAFTYYPVTDDRLRDIVNFDIACCEKESRPVILRAMRLCIFNGTIDMTRISSLGSCFRWFISRHIPVRSLYGVRVLKLEAFCRSLQYKEHTENARCDSAAVQYFFQNIYEMHHVLLQYQDRAVVSELKGIDQLRFLLRSLPQTHLSPTVNTTQLNNNSNAAAISDSTNSENSSSSTEVFAASSVAHLSVPSDWYFANIKFWSLADHTDLKGLWNMQDFTPQFAPYLHNHVFSAPLLDHEQFPVLFLSSLMTGAPLPYTLQNLDVIQPPASLHRTAAATLVREMTHLQSLRLLNCHLPDADILRLLYTISGVAKDKTVFPLLKSLHYHQAMSANFQGPFLHTSGSDHWLSIWQLYLQNHQILLMQPSSSPMTPVISNTSTSTDSIRPPQPPTNRILSAHAGEDIHILTHIPCQLQYLRLHLAARSLGTAATASDLPSILLLSSASSLRSITCIDLSVTPQTMRTIYILLRAPVSTARALCFRNLSIPAYSQHSIPSFTGDRLRHISITRHTNQPLMREELRVPIKEEALLLFTADKLKNNETNSGANDNRASNTDNTRRYGYEDNDDNRIMIGQWMDDCVATGLQSVTVESRCIEQWLTLLFFEFTTAARYLQHQYGNNAYHSRNSNTNYNSMNNNTNNTDYHGYHTFTNNTINSDTNNGNNHNNSSSNNHNIRKTEWCERLGQGYALRHLHLSDLRHTLAHTMVNDVANNNANTSADSNVLSLHLLAPLLHLHSLHLDHINLQLETIRWLLFRPTDYLPHLQRLHWTNFSSLPELKSLLAEYYEHEYLGSSTADVMSDNNSSDDSNVHDSNNAHSKKINTDHNKRNNGKCVSRLHRLTLAPSPRFCLDENTSRSLLALLCQQHSICLSHLTLLCCRLNFQEHVQRYLVRGPWQRLSHLNIEFIGDISYYSYHHDMDTHNLSNNSNTTTNTQKIDTNASSDIVQNINNNTNNNSEEVRGGCEAVQVLELSNCAELTVAGIRRLLHLPAVVSSTNTNASCDNNSESNRNSQFRANWPALRMVRLTAASLRPSPFNRIHTNNNSTDNNANNVYHNDSSNSTANAATTTINNQSNHHLSVSAASIEDTHSIKRQLVVLAEELRLWQVQVYDGYRFL